MKNREDNFLESSTFFGWDVLIPINRIKFITLGYTNKQYEIKIVSDDGDWFEVFNNEKDSGKRYNQIKQLIKAL